MKYSELSSLSYVELNYLQLIATCKIYNQTPIKATVYEIDQKHKALTVFKQKPNNKIATKTIKLRVKETDEMLDFLVKDFEGIEIDIVTPHENNE